MDTELDGSPNTKLLEEVFNEVESLENSASEEFNKSKPGFLEDVVNLETSAMLNNENVKKRRKKIKQSNNPDILKEENSLIHEGLTDSSDDEDNKYFEESKYNDCGRQLKNLLKEKTNSKDHLTLKTLNTEDTWTELQSANKTSRTLTEKLKGIVESNNKSNEKGNLLIDPVLGMRVINPLASSNILKSKMIGRVSIGTCKIKKFLESPTSKESDWVTGGVIISKYNRTSQKGNQYCIWNVTDLTGEIKIVCLFLFGSAYKEYWKTPLGTVVGVLNPVVMDSKEKSEATLRIDNAQKILLIGTSKDYGICKSKKKNGENCSAVVNKARCDFCTYHMQKEYKKACRRPDLIPPKIGRRSLDKLEAKVLGKNQVFYSGKTFTSVIGKKSSKQLEKDQKRLKALSERVPGASKSQADKDQHTLSRLSGKTGVASTTPKEFTTTLKSPPDFIDLNFTISKKDKNAAKANALKYIRMHGPIKKVPDDIKKRTPEQILSLKRKLDIEEEKESKKVKKGEMDSEETKPLEKKFIKNGITNKFLELMNSGDRHCDLVKVAESEVREKYFNKLETREKIEEKMASTFKVECKAVRCLKCNYKSFSASELCKKEKHPLKVVNAMKRFWKCGNCSARTVCLELVPLHACKVCGSSKWERASMMAEKKGPNLVVEPLSLRGNEEKFIGAVVKNASLNLLVPEEVS